MGFGVAAGLSVVALLVLAGGAFAVWWRVAMAKLTRRRREVEDRARQHRLDYLWKYANDIVLLGDVDRRILEANDRAVEAYRFSRAELLQLRIDDLRTPEAEADPALEERLSSEGAMRFETVHRRKDGSTFPVELSIRTFTAEGRQLVYAIARDISDRKQVEKAARLQASLLSHLNDAVVAVDRELRITAWTGAAERIYGWSASEALGRPMRQALGSDIDDAELARTRAELEGGRTVSTVSVQRARDGKPLDIEMTLMALRDMDGRVVGYLGVNRDVTEQRRLQAHLVFADRLASIGTLAAGVAHEINNPLAYLLASIQFLEGRLREGRDGAEADGETLEAVSEARDGAQRIAEIVRSLRTFAQRDRERAPGASDLREAVRAAARIADSQIRPRARLSLDLREVPRVRANEHELAQVALNLIVNAAQAIPQGRAADNEIRVATRLVEDGRVALEVSDTGKGIAPDDLARIFDPFFTTKPVGEGSGLGLSICHGIVQALGGEISAESEPGRGSLFRVLLRVADERGAPAPASVPAPSAGRRRVLVLDDEPLVCRAVARMLVGEHDVVTLSEPAEALARLTGGEFFDIVLCDLMMPGMSGIQCYEALRASRPELARRMVFLTGGAFTEEAQAFLERVPNARLEKPFEAEALRDVVARGVG
jgi:PAS domain S-box-containing protein